MNKMILIILVIQTIILSRIFAQENIHTEITYIGNEGFMISNNNKNILIDVLYNNTANNGIMNVDESINNQIMNKQEPFTNIDLYLVSHGHSDHYDKTMVSFFLGNNPQFILVADSTITKPLKVTFSDQLFSANPGKYQSVDTILKGIQLSVYNLKHNSAVNIYNVGYWANIDGLKIFHSGDNILEDTTEYLNCNLFEKQVDVAFLNHNGFLKSSINSEFIKNHMKPNYIVLMHIPDSQLSSVKEKVSKLDDSYPPVFVFNASLEKITISTPTIFTTEKQKSLSIYPNPAFSQLCFNSNISTNSKIQIFDLQGRLLIAETSSSYPIDISNLSKGTYILQIIDSGKVTKQKIVKD
jgi:L-ascorbate metabolism protein UlaG (beta-lactamase superfamily)